MPQVGEGSSFRRQERERYAAPGLRNMANLAHATEEELLAAAEVQVLSRVVWEWCSRMGRRSMASPPATGAYLLQAAAQLWLPRVLEGTPAVYAFRRRCGRGR